MENLNNKIIYERLSKNNFSIHSLDGYNRYQETEENLRLVNGKYVYVKTPFVENWNKSQLIEKAQKIIKLIGQNCIGYIAKHEGRIIGFAYLGTNFLGSDNQYIELKMFHVSNEFRNNGIGKKLFTLVCSEAKKLPIKKVYISANSAKESQKAYEALGCVLATEIQQSIAEKEPFDIQLEYTL